MSERRATVTPAPSGWNTWDVRTHTGMSRLPSGPRVRFGVLGPEGPVLDGFTWRDGLERLGPHTVDGSYAEVTVRAAGHRLRLEFAGGPGDVLDARAESTGVIVLSVEGLDDIEESTDLTATVRAGGIRWTVTTSSRARRVEGPEGALVLAFDTEASEGAVNLHIAPATSAPQRGAGPYRSAAPPRGATSPHGAAAERLHIAALTAERTSLRSGGWLGDAADALTRAVTWNTIYAPDIGRVLTPTSRDFVCAERKGFYGSWALHAWDTFFTGLAASAVDRDYARGVFEQVLPYADEAGMIPNRISDDRGRTDDRSQPPVGALTVYQAYLAGGLSPETRDATLLEGTFPALLAWHDWWPRARRGPHGLLAWGSDPIPGDPASATLDRAKRESGLDDSPMYDETRYDPVTHTMDLADVGLNALHIADAEALAEIAGILGERATADRLHAEAATARAIADRLLWDGEASGYRNLTSAGAHDPHVSPTMLYALLAGLPDAGRAAAVATDLLRPEVLGGERPLPSVARNDPGFAATYWRGRIWAPMAYLAVSGLRRYGLAELSRPVVGALLRLFLDEWRVYGHVRENYPAVDGENLTGLQKRSDGLMAWGGLLAYLAFGELADARSDGWRFAHPGEPAELCNLPLGEGRLDVRAAGRLTVSLEGRVLLDMAPGVVVRGYLRTTDRVTGIAEGIGDLLVAPPGDGPPARVDMGDSGSRSFTFGPDTGPDSQEESGT
ncbi:amylo-alpha-1,6-glucosidase [Streptomyces sp. GESEQ-35]|uniref:amylo-alpha-1,6-glucosidase n=1 Tax=Streptomyces sp. GESEQ-35 TaxID=2812657 RepID=UPI001B342FC3|nr:trehalase family glycosidase [Streptomyces sp. GESEQ-35]